MSVAFQDTTGRLWYASEYFRVGAGVASGGVVDRTHAHLRFESEGEIRHLSQVPLPWDARDLPALLEHATQEDSSQST